MGINDKYLEKIFDFQQKVRKRNPIVASRVGEAILGLAAYEGDLSQASREQLLGIKGIGEQTVNLYEQIIKGERIEEIITTIPTNIRPLTTRKQATKDRREWDGSWDNTVRTLEDK